MLDFLSHFYALNWLFFVAVTMGTADGTHGNSEDESKQLIKTTSQLFRTK
jgi:hypothetical protein